MNGLQECVSQASLHLGILRAIRTKDRGIHAVADAQTGRGICRKAILDMAAKGRPFSKHDVCTRTPVVRPTVIRRVMTELIESGQIAKLAQGIYAAPGTPAPSPDDKTSIRTRGQKASVTPDAILAFLDSPRTNADISSKFRVTPGAVRYRMKQLKEQGLIRDHRVGHTLTHVRLDKAALDASRTD